MTSAFWSPPRGLSPTPGQARSWLQQELQGSDYRSSWLDSITQWISDQLRRLMDGAGKLSGISPVITVLTAAIGIALLVYVLPRVRHDPIVTGTAGAVLDDLTITPRLYRDRAAAAMHEGRYGDAVLDGFRAIAKDMADRQVIDDAPGRTAHEVSLALTSTFPGHADALVRAADLFDAVRYGHRQADIHQADQIRRLDAELVATRPRVPVWSSPESRPA